MTIAAFDTLKFAQALRERGKLTAEQAEGIAGAMSDAFEGDIATKRDVQDVRSDLRETELQLQSDLRETEMRLQSDLRETELRLRSELREVELRLEAKIEAGKADIIKWMFGTIGFQTLVVVGAIVALTRTFQP